MNIGSIWHRWDLHYHTPSSYDYKNKAKTNEVLPFYISPLAEL